MNKHENLKQVAIEAVRELCGDTSVGNLETRDSLVEVREEINSMIDAIDEDVEHDAANL